jgi:hypothetical protein
MKKIFLLLLPFIAVLCFSSCTTQSYVGGFANFVDRTDANCHNYSIKRWERNIKQFKKYSVDRFYKEKSNLTASQLKEVLRLDARYVGIVSSQGLVQAKDLINEAKTIGPDMIGSFLNEFLKRTNKRGDD